MANHCIEVGCLKCGRMECCRCSDESPPSEERAKFFRESKADWLNRHKPMLIPYDPNNIEDLLLNSIPCEYVCCGIPMIHV